MPLLESDLFEVMKAVTNETLDEIEVKFKNQHACCVIMASKGYPEAYEKGYEMNIPEEISSSVFVAGAKKDGEKLLTNGGRVLGATAIGEDLSSAIASAYGLVEKISFDNAYFRHDIGARALKAVEEKN